MAIPLIALAWLVNASELHVAVEAEDLTKVQQLVDGQPDLVNTKNEAGVTPLHLAAGLNNTNLVDYLISKGADAKAATKQGWTPLHWAAHLNAAAAVTLLLEKGVDPSAKAVDGKTPLQVAIAENAHAVVVILTKQTSAIYTDKSLDVSYDLATKAQASGDLKQAYDLFNKLVNDDPANEKYNFALGMTCLALKEFAFDRVLNQNPNNGRARVELARCLIGLGQDAAARNEFEKVLAANPPDEVKRNIEAHIEEIERRVKKWHFNGRVDIMLFDDSNVNVGPDSERISIAPIVFGSLSITELTVQQASQPADSSGYAGSFFAGALYDVGESGKWGWGSTAAIYNNWLADRSESESLFYQIDTGPKYLADRGYFESPIRYAHISIGGDSLVDLYGVHPGFMYVHGPAGEWRFGTLTSFEKRDYASLDDRDGVFASIGEMIRYYFGENRHSLLMGVVFSHDFTKSGVYEYRGRECQFGAEFKLPWQVSAYGRVRYANLDYEEKEILAPSDRNDRQSQYVIGLSKLINGWWGGDVNYQSTDNTSTFALYQYDRNVVTVSTFLSF